MIKNLFLPTMLILAMCFGAMTGFWFPKMSPHLKPLGDIFLHLILTAIVPMIFFSVTSAIARAKTNGKLTKLPVLLKIGDNISTDEIMPAGARVLPFRSNIPKISEFVFEQIDDTYHKRAEQLKSVSRHAIVGGENYGQGSSREHAALAPRYLGLQLVIAKSFARIHWQNLINFGILPLTFADPKDYLTIDQGDVIIINDVKQAIQNGSELHATIENKNNRILLRHQLSERQIEVLMEGGLINWIRKNVD